MENKILNIIKKIKILLALNSSINKIKENKMKNGIKTTEFWLTVLTQLGVVIGALNGVIPAETATISTIVINAVYTVMRSLSKNPEITTLSKTDIKPNV